MVTGNSQQQRFSHEEWIEQLSQFWVTFKQLLTEFFKVLKVLFQKGKNEAWKEVRSSGSKLQKKDFVWVGILLSIGLLGGLILLIGFAVLAYQCFLWLQNGVWTEYDLFAVFNYVFENTEFHQWVINPESWIGMQKLLIWFLEAIPLSLALMVPGFSIAISAIGIFFAVLVLRYYQLKKL
jgi:hypothetical protein